MADDAAIRTGGDDVRAGGDDDRARLEAALAGLGVAYELFACDPTLADTGKLLAAMFLFYLIGLGVLIGSKL